MAPAGAARRCVLPTFSCPVLEALAEWLHDQGVTEVVMEATGQYWKPIWYVLEERGLRAAAGQRPPRQDPARPQDRRWRRRVAGRAAGARAAARQLRAAGGHPRAAGPDPLPQAADPGPHRRVPAHPEDPGGRLASSSTRSPPTCSASRAGRCCGALVAGERDPEVARRAGRGRLRKKIPELREALRGRFGDHHALLVRLCPGPRRRSSSGDRRARRRGRPGDRPFRAGP